MALPLVLVLVVAAVIVGVLLGRRHGGGVRSFPANGVRVIRPPAPVQPAAPASGGLPADESSQSLADAINRATEAANVHVHVTPEMLAQAKVTSSVSVSTSEGTLDPAQAQAVMAAVSRAMAGNGATTAELPPGAEIEVRELLRGGHKIAAVKRVREVTGLDLSGAKAIVDAMG